MIIPIRTDAPRHLTPYANYALIGANVVVFVVLNVLGGPVLDSFRDRTLELHVYEPHLLQFFTYQFLHGGWMHLAGNMLFLWVFGNSVNDKMGNVPYVLFYLAGGVFSAWGFSLSASSQGTTLIGASGSISAVTGAYLVLFPRCRVKVLYFFFIIGFFDIPAMILIVLKIIVWDNMIAPGLQGGDAVAHGAHLAGYAFGIGATLVMLTVRAIGRDHYDMLSLWDRANRRRQWRSAMAQTGARERATYGSVARVEAPSGASTAPADPRMDRLAQIRDEISRHLAAGDVSGACACHEALVAEDPRQCLSEREQLRVAREFYRTGRFPQAAAAFDRFLNVYRHSSETAEVRLLLGIIYARDLRQFEAADTLLSRSLTELPEGTRRAQCLRWLHDVRAALGRPDPAV